MNRRRLLLAAPALLIPRGAFAESSAQRVVRYGGFLPKPILDLRFIEGAMDSRVSFTRATIASDYSGKQYASGAVRVPVAPGSVVGNGYLSELSRTQRALWCRDFTNAAWVKTTCTAALNQVGIDGAANSASSLTATLGNALALQTNITTSAARRFSIFMRRLTGVGPISLTLDNGVTLTDVSGSINSSTYSRVAIGQTLANPIFGIKITTSGDAVAVDFAQLENSAFDTSPVLATTASVIRNADVATMLMTAVPMNGLAFTMIATFLQPVDPAASSFLCTISDGTTPNSFGFNRQSGGAMSAGNGASAAVSLATAPAGAWNRVAASFDLTGVSISLNGAATVTGSGVASFAPTTVSIGAGATGANQLSGFIRRLTIYPTRIADERLPQFSYLGPVS